MYEKISINLLPLLPFLADNILIDDRISMGDTFSLTVQDGPESGIYFLDISSLTCATSGTGISNGRRILTPNSKHGLARENIFVNQLFESFFNKRLVRNCPRTCFGCLIAPPTLELRTCPIRRRTIARALFPTS